MVEAVEFNPEKFEVLVLFITDQRKHDPQFGRTKLAKTLFYSDFDIYRDTGDSITGATYIRMPFGPFPEQLEEAETSLERRGLVRLDYVKGEYEEKRIVPTEPPPKLNVLFEPWVLEHVKLWINQVGAASAREISRLSHKHPGWLMARETGAPIPYQTALLPNERPTGQDAELAKKIARERGWLSDAGFIWERKRDSR